ncbi:MAG: ABC transporter substrate-binding protein [Melioribacteraceae bacterium]|nr:ABC transporter substrate-binding protein [Melioribacteraceae bacterium]
MLTIVLTALFLIAGLYLTPDVRSENNSNAYQSYERIISLSPSTTETIFALGLGSKLVGVTQFCNYPPEAKEIKNVGGYFDPNYEAITMLQPDLVIILPEHESVKQYLSELGINYLVVNNKTIADILSTIETIGKVCNAEIKAGQLLQDINSRINNIKEKTKDLGLPRVLISVGRTIGEETLKEVYIVGQNTYYNELINFAGGENAFQNDRIEYPMLSAEGIILINPEIIIDLIADLESSGLTESKVKEEWESVGSVEAVKNNRLYVFTKGYIVIPGPRFILLLEDLARVIHPEIEWN